MGPLKGVRVVEMAGIGPGPFCAMMLADAGADVISVERNRSSAVSGPRDPRSDPLLRNRRCLSLDLKKPGAAEVVLALLASADVLIEGFRPGVMERLGLGPDVCLQANPRLVYGRMTGWGQTGPLAAAAGHDLNYISLSGALHATGVADHPVPPLNLVGDFGGGAMLLAFGIAAALWQSARTGRGQVIDAAMCDGAALLMAPFFSMHANGSWADRREANVLDGAAPYYGTYRCSDGRFVSVAPLEPAFYDEFLRRMGIDEASFGDRTDRQRWPQMRAALAERFARKTRAEWCALLEGTDACFAPVLGLAEAPSHPHNMQREVFVDVEGSQQPAPAPRFGATPSARPCARRADAATARRILEEAGFDPTAIDALRQAGIWTTPPDIPPPNQQETR